ncbi:MAG: site-2 protease family protein [Fimbriiglobus sp.]|jgi:Zn-dependent protease|nr:site-2 protease family protein [Fimbriiglobus sp.]
MIGVDSSSPLDLRFRLGPIPVTIGLMFWIFTGIFGFMSVQNLPQGALFINLLVWVGCVLVSILVHELGHVLAFRFFGSWASITLHGFGGYALAPDPPAAAWKRMLVSLAGPVAGFTLFGIVFGVTLALRGTELNVYVVHALVFLWWINLFWNIFNLLPILPLDGGNVCRELLATFRVRSADTIAAGVGFLFALVLAIYGALWYARLLPEAAADLIPSWLRPGPMMTLWFALFAVDNYQRMQLARRRRGYYEPPDDDDDTPPWRR